MTIRKRLIGGNILISSLVVIIGCIGYSGIKNINTSFVSIVGHTTKELIALENLKSSTMQMQLEVMSYGLITAEHSLAEKVTPGTEHAEEELKEVEESKQQIYMWLAEFEKTADGPEQISINNVKKSLKKIEELAEELIRLKTQGIFGDAIVELKTEFEEAEETFLNAIDKTINEELEEFEEKKTQASLLSTKFSWVIIFLSIICVCLALAIGLSISFNIINSVSNLQSTTLSFGNGNLKERALVKSNDEIGELAMAFNQMAGKLAHSTISKEYLDNILGNLVDMLIVIDSKGNIVLSNKMANTELNLGSKKRIDEVFQDLDHDSGQVWNGGSEKHDHFKNGELPVVETEIITSSGQMLPLEITVSSIKNNNDKIILARNISARRQASQKQENLTNELKSVNQELQEMVFIISHDLKTPLRGISMLADWLSKDASDLLDENNIAHLSSIQGRIKRMYALLEGILEYSKIGQKEIGMSDINLNQIVKDVAESIAAAYPGAEIRLDMELPILKANETQMNQLF